MSAISGVAPEGAGSKQPIPPVLVFRDLPGIAAIEAASGVRGIEWQDDYLHRCDAASLSLFGITEAQTRPPCPDRHTYDAPDRAFAGIYTSDDLRSWESAHNLWDAWCQRIDDDAAYLSDMDALVLWEDQVVDLTDGKGSPLKCLPRFLRQFVAATCSLHPAAKLTPEGVAPSDEAWGSALEAEAKAFRSRR